MNHRLGHILSLVDCPSAIVHDYSLWREGFATVASRELCPPAFFEESTMNTAAKPQTDNRHGSAFDLDVESSQTIR